MEERVLYVSIPFATVMHLCCCGCGNQVVTPLSPADWELSFDGESISLAPAVGNGSFPCQSHYWIRNDRAEWAPKWSPQQIAAGRARDERRTAEYYAAFESGPDVDAPATVPKPRTSSVGPYGGSDNEIRRCAVVARNGVDFDSGPMDSRF
jgi:hypothetical protein